MVPAALDSLSPQERCQRYGMLRLKVDVLADGTMQARGVLSAELPVARGEAAGKCAAWRIGEVQRQRATPEIQNSFSCASVPC